MYLLTHGVEGIMVFIFRDFYFPTYWAESEGRGPINRKIKTIMHETLCVNWFIAWEKFTYCNVTR